MYNINQAPQGTPQEAFDTICKSSAETPLAYQILSTIGWSKIAAEITTIGNCLIFPASGLVLCAFAISCIKRNPAFKLPHITLDQGTECIKQLYEIIISASTTISDEDKATAIQWNNEFLDIWKHKISDALEQEDLLIG